MSGLLAVGLFVVSLFFSLIIVTLWLRIALRYLHISTLNPVNQLVHKSTDPLIYPLQFLIKPKPGQKYDVAAICVLILVEIARILTISLFAFHTFMPAPYFIIYVFADMLIQPCNFLFFAILIRVIMSFANPGWNGPIEDVLRKITEPFLNWGRKIIPNISGFDFSPFIILMLLKVITLFIEGNLPWRLL